jgi:hypothetical protein
MEMTLKETQERQAPEVSAWKGKTSEVKTK